MYEHVQLGTAGFIMAVADNQKNSMYKYRPDHLPGL